MKYDKIRKASFQNRPNRILADIIRSVALELVINLMLQTCPEIHCNRSYLNLTRVKTPESIVKKIRRYGYETSIENMVKYINDNSSCSRRHLLIASLRDSIFSSSVDTI